MAPKKSKKQKAEAVEPANQPVAQPAATAPAPALPAVPFRELLVLFLVSLVARLLYLGRADLWCDEILFVGMSSPPLTPWGAFKGHWDQFLAIGHFPLGPVIQNICLWLMKPFATDILHATFIQRLPSAVMGALAVPVFYRTARLLVSRDVALAAAGMMAIFFYPVFFSRESYYYAPLLIFSVLAGLQFVRFVVEGRLTRRRGWFLFLALAAAAQCHLTGVTVSLGLASVCLIILLLNRYPTDGDPALLRKDYQRALGWVLAAAATTLPFYGRRFLNPTTQVFQEQPSLVGMTVDYFGKAFLGLWPAASALGLLLLVAGLVVGTVLDAERRRGLRVAAGIFLIPFTIILLVMSTTQYFSRYFFTVAPYTYLFIALGMYAVGKGLAKMIPVLRGKEGRMALVMAGAAAAVHVVLFLPTMYQLPAKGVDYGGIARWLKANLPPGTPFVMESAYELRFTSGYHPTQGLIPVAPYVHGAGPEEMERLRSRQKDFMERFPEAVFVESARTGTEPGATYGTWSWPREHFRQEHELRNQPLERLAELGIWPQVPKKEVSLIQYSTPILYNTPEDRRAVAVAGGRPLEFDFTGWSIQQVQQGVYARVQGGMQGTVRVTPLTDQPVRGRLMVVGALAGGDRAYDFELRYGGASLGTSQRWGGALWSLETPVIEFGKSGSLLEWSVASDARMDLQGFILMDLRFVPEGAPSPLQAGG